MRIFTYWVYSTNTGAIIEQQFKNVQVANRGWFVETEGEYIGLSFIKAAKLIEEWNRRGAIRTGTSIIYTSPNLSQPKIISRSPLRFALLRAFSCLSCKHLKTFLHYILNPNTAPLILSLAPSYPYQVPSTIIPYTAHSCDSMREHTSPASTLSVSLPLTPFPLKLSL